MTRNSNNARVQNELQHAHANGMFEAIYQFSKDGIVRGLGHLSAGLDENPSARVIKLEGREVLNFASCSYLALEHEPELVAGVIEAVQRFGTQFSSSRTYLSISQYDELENLLDQIFERPTIACPSTTLGHMSALPVLVHDADAVIVDQQVHHSVQTAAQLLKARGIPLHVVRHNSMDKLEQLVERLASRHRAVWYLADGVYSMYGDTAPLPELTALMNRHQRMWLYIDDAHGMGWAGSCGRGFVRGSIEHHPRMVLAASLNKSFAAGGGVLVFPNQELRERVRVCGPTMIFSGPLQPPMLGAAMASARLHLSPRLPELQADLQERIQYTQRRLHELGLPQVSLAHTPLFFVPVGIPSRVFEVCERLLADGCYTNPGIFPAVPIRQGGVRFTVHRGVDHSAIDQLVTRMAKHYYDVLRDHGETLSSVGKAFRRAGFVRPQERPQALPQERSSTPMKPTAVQDGGLRVRYAEHIAEVEPTQWNRVFSGRGAMTTGALELMERVFAGAQDEASRAEPGYLWVEDASGQLVVASMHSVARVKDDMFEREEVSRTVEQVRRERDPNYLVSRSLVLGTPLSVGQHLFVDQSHPQWRLAVARWNTELQAVKQRKGAEQVIVRDLPADDESLVDCLRQLGFSAHRLPDMLVMPSLNWSSRQEYLQGLGQKYRYNVKKEAIAFEDRFDLVAEQGVDSATVRRCYDLYSAVHARSYKINVFRLPIDLFEQAFNHPEFDILRLYLRGSREPADLVACLVSHVSGGHYSALLVGLEESLLTSHRIYKQILFRCVERAHALKATALNLAFTADLEKKKLGARPMPTLALVQQDDDYAATAMAAI